VFYCQRLMMREFAVHRPRQNVRTIHNWPRQPRGRRGEYVGWLAIPTQSPDIIAGGAGVQLREVLPHPVSCGNQRNGVAEGRHAIIINVFTEPEWRHQGVAMLLLERIIQWARAERLDRLVLHASEAGRPLYERLGFVDTNEMRFAGE
jgi:GNAT superfamily N-acetyltransferase